jgi:cytochrome c biogenesis protein CcdA
MFEGKAMKQILEWSGMWITVLGIVMAIVGLVVLIVTEDSWILYAAGYAVGLLGVLLLFWAVLRDRLKARKTDDLDDVGFT